MSKGYPGVGKCQPQKTELIRRVATLMIARGVPLGDVAKYLGDTVETVVRSYLHATGADPADAMDELFER